MADQRITRRGAWLIAILAVTGVALAIPAILRPPSSYDQAPGVVQILIGLRGVEARFKTDHGRYATLDQLAAARLSPVSDGELHANARCVFRSTAEYDSYAVIARPVDPGQPAYAMVDGRLLCQIQPEVRKEYRRWFERPH